MYRDWKGIVLLFKRYDYVCRKLHIIYQILLELKSEYTKTIGYKSIYRRQRLSYVPIMNDWNLIFKKTALKFDP